MVSLLWFLPHAYAKVVFSVRAWQACCEKRRHSVALSLIDIIDSCCYTAYIPVLKGKHSLASIMAANGSKSLSVLLLEAG